MEEVSAPGHTVVHVYNVPSGIDRQQLNGHVGQLTTGRHVDTSINRLNKTAMLTFEGPAKILKTTSALHDQTLFVMPEMIETVTVTVRKQWADILRHCGQLDFLLKSGVTVVKDASSFALSGSDKNDVFSSLDNCRKFAAKYFAMVGDKESKSRQVERSSVTPPRRVESTAATTSGAIVESVVNIDREFPAETQHYTVDESLWEYIKFTHADSNWASKLTAVTCVDGSGKTDLYGTADDIETFTKLCIAGRLQRTVVGKMVRVPVGFTANTFAAVVGRLARKTALVRSTSDPGFCQVICKSSAFEELTRTIDARFTRGPTLAAVKESADTVVKSKVSDNVVFRHYEPSSARPTVRTVDTDQQLDVLFKAPRSSVSLQHAADVKSSTKLSQSQSFSVKSTDVSYPAASHSSASSKPQTKFHPASGTSSDPHVAPNSYSYPHTLELGMTAGDRQVPMFQTFRPSTVAEPTSVSPTFGTSKTVETGHNSSLIRVKKDRDVEVYQKDTTGALTSPPFVFTGTKSSAPQVQISSGDWKYMHKVTMDDRDLPLMTDETVEHASAENMNFQSRTVSDMEARPHRKSTLTGAQRSETVSKPQLKSSPKSHMFSKSRSDVAGPLDAGPVQLVSAAVQSPSNPSLVTLSADSYADKTGYDDLTLDFSLPRASVDALPATSVQSRSKSAASPVKLSQKLLSAADSSADDDKNCVEFVTPRSQLTVRLKVGDILRQSDCDVIVTPCGKNLEHATGLAKLVAKAAGSDLVLQCRNYVQSNRKGMRVSDVIDTVAGDLFPPVNRVIHCCVPTSRDANCQQMLTTTYRNCIVHAYSKVRAESVAIPALGSGAAGVPINTVAAAACSALMDFDDYLSQQQQQQQQKEPLSGGVTFIDLNADAIKCIADSLSHLGLTSKGALPDTANSVKSQSKAIDYKQLKHHAAQRSLLIVEVPMDGDCALHAIVDQLNNALNNSRSSKGNNPFDRPHYDVKTLRQRAVAYLMSNPPDNEFLVKSEYRSQSQYIERQSVAGTWCDEPMLRAVAEVTDTEIHVLHENGRASILQPSVSRSSDPRGSINVGLVGTHYVSLRPSSSSSSSAAAAVGGDGDTLFPLSQMRSESSSALSKFSRSQTARHSIAGSLANYSKPDSRRRLNDRTSAIGDLFDNKSLGRRTTIQYPNDLLQ